MMTTRLVGQKVPVLEGGPAAADAGPTALLARVHPTCRTPWCDAPAVHTGHVVDRAKRGLTTLANAQGLCEACNYVTSPP